MINCAILEEEENWLFSSSTAGDKGKKGKYPKRLGLTSKQRSQ